MAWVSLQVSHIREILCILLLVGLSRSEWLLNMWPFPSYATASCMVQVRWSVHKIIINFLGIV